eukprot:Gregarina_sp_Poly_1__2933@NODE_181_length_11831_cov_65_262326_g161_i0_p5_GENE_NODE_181_length_11831_cov_65_262326_g161_i0NODE_181_length_11831_cov_65_262326_g161_i0_p5_ORF_typecomplete_len386_score43_67Fumble/PF03630_14/5_4e82Fumble/PF03630_14/0_00054ROK/PF00480_20/80ROK/PF00480_20/1_5_NODE_181_length_11831_cov_65_262326_g161_i022123369
MKLTPEEAELFLKNRIGLDIGGTLAKVAFVTQSIHEQEALTTDEFENTRPLRFWVGQISYSICFKYFCTSSPQDLIDFVAKLNPGPFLRVTGGGAHKFHDILSHSLNVEIVKCDEMYCVVRGMTLTTPQKGEAIFFDLTKKKKVTRELSVNLYPCILVSIGSGVSILKVTDKDDFERISGTCIGGGTVLGLAKLCFGAESFDEVVDLSEKGTDRLDLKVGHLRGDTAGSGALPADTLASSFGRLYIDDNPGALDFEITREDVARSAIQMVSYNVGYLALLLAKVHNVNRIFFGGKYINNHSFTMKTITQAVTFYSSYYGQLKPNGSESVSLSEWERHTGTNQTGFESSVASLQRCSRQWQGSQRVEALFLRHDGYLGAIGALLHQ